MKTFFKVFVVVASVMIVFCERAAAQDDIPVISSPEDPREVYVPSKGDGYLFQTGGFISTAGGGMNLTYRPGRQPWYGGLYLGGLSGPGERIEGARGIRYGALTVGYEHVLNPESDIYVDSGVIRSDREGVQLYMRTGTGLNVTQVDHIDAATGEQNRRFHPGIYSNLLFGASSGITRNTSFYMEIGGLLTWNSGLPEMRWIAGPYLSFGVLLFGSQPGQMPPSMYAY